MKSRTLRTTALIMALFGALAMADAKPGKGGRDGGSRDGVGKGRGGQKCQKHDGKRSRENVRDRFDRNDDGKLGPKEREALKRRMKQRKKHQQRGAE
jgi:hypothetical protein